MPEVLQKPLVDWPIAITSEADGWNFPRSTVSFATPDGNSDETLGFWYGSFWMDISNNRLYVCSDPATGVAVWQLVIGW